MAHRQSPPQEGESNAARNTASLNPAPTPARKAGIGEGTAIAQGRFIIHEELGFGSSATVYRAHDLKNRLDVALKIFHQAGAEGLRSVKREVRFLRDLDHPTFVRIHELFLSHLPPFFSMSLEKGQPLSAALRDGAPINKVCEEITTGLICLHDNGRIHADLKPENILVTQQGDVKLLDFGSAILLNKKQKAPQRVGTTKYWAPEIPQGNLPSPESDAYALGAILFDAICLNQHFLQIPQERRFQE
ncbi:MAG: serine/threonine protein kinase, partial [Polyangiaceae bacterium]|nr:serine/threonine protein kinase [Polyangiaceae bacterium]